MPTQTFDNLPADKREKFIDAALEEFANNSYTNASVGRIADRAGIAKGSVYQYFQDKKDLYLYMIDLGTRLKLDYLRDKQAEVDWSDFFGGFKSYLLLGTRFEFSGPRAVRFAGLLRKALASDIWEESFAKMKAQSQAGMVGLVARAQAQGQIRNDIPVEMAAYYVNSLITGIADYVASRLGIGLTELADRLLETQKPAPSDRQDADKLDILGLDFVQIIDDLVELMRSGLAPARGQ